MAKTGLAKGVIGAALALATLVPALATDAAFAQRWRDRPPPGYDDDRPPPPGYYRRGDGYYRRGPGGPPRGYRDRPRRCRDKGTGGTIIGAIAGGLLGDSIAGRGDRTAGALIGGGLGALAGRAVDRDC